jgi:hypothetical protein
MNDELQKKLTAQQGQIHALRNELLDKNTTASARAFLQGERLEYYDGYRQALIDFATLIDKAIWLEKQKKGRDK